MRISRAVSGVVSCAAVVGCAILVIGMANAGKPSAPRSASASPAADRTSRPAYLPRSSDAAPTTTSAARSSTVRASSTAASSTAAARTTSTSRPPTTRPVTTTTATAAPAPRATTRAVVARPSTHRSAVIGHRLPLKYSTGSATRAITVTAGSSGSTTARLQAWTRVSSGRWKQYGSAITARVGADGIGKASESRSKTPAGSFTITQAFGRQSDPGTRLPYFKTRPSDYWISSAGSKYNTHQRCGSCGYDNGVNERLYYVTPHYNYAAVIDYNTRNAPGGVHAGRGSAFFLHVSVGEATAGCVAIPQNRLITLLRWLTPSAHPRILIGVT